MTSGAVMAKRSTAKGKTNPDAMVTRALKMRQEYASWLERFADRERVTLASLIDRALAAHARDTGFDPAPERTP